MPFPFFLDLYRTQEKQVVKLAERVEQAEKIAAKHLGEAQQSKDLDAKEAQTLRDKIFLVCKMLFEQQKKAGYTLALLEAKVQ